MKDLITEARELCENARPGPYDVRNDNDGTDYFPFWVISRETDDDGEWFAELHVGDFPTARFFARSRTLIPELCDALEKAEAQIKSIHQSLDFAETQRQKCKNYTELAINNGLALGRIAVILQHDFEPLPAPPEK